MMARGLAALAVTLLLAAPAFAQDESSPPPPAPPPAVAPAPAAAPAPAYAAGRHFEAEAGITLGYPKDGDFAFTFAASFRYFIINGLSVGLSLRPGVWTVSSGGESYNSTIFMLVPHAQYNLNIGSKIFPYAGLGLGMHYYKFESGGFSGDSTDFLLEFNVGVKVPLGKIGVIGGGLNIPLVFADSTIYYINFIVHYAYYF